MIQTAVAERQSLVLISVQDAMEEWLTDRVLMRNLSPRSVFFYRHKLAPLMAQVGDQPLHELTYEQVTQWLMQRKQETSAANMATHFRAIRALLHWCDRQDYPVARRLLRMEGPVKLQGRIEVLTAPEIQRLRESMTSRRDALLLSLLLGTGARLSELAGVKPSDRLGDQLRLWGKGRKERVVPLSIRIQRDWVRYRSTDATLLGLSPHGIQTLLRRVGLKTGIHANPHKFRHTFATEFCRKAMAQGLAPDLERLRLILGHTSYALLPIYVNLAKSDVVQGWERVAPY